jgi:hypothetical protein
LITSYATLQQEVADELNRSDLSTLSGERAALGLTLPSVKTLIQLAESKMRRDFRIRKLQERSPFTVSADNADLPSDIREIQSLAHDGGTYYGPIRNAQSMARLAEYKSQFGLTGAPRYFVRLGSKLRFAPAPDASFSLKLEYWMKPESLSDTATTNWLLDEQPDIYFYAVLLESAPYLKDDARIEVWQSQYEQRAEELYMMTDKEMTAGDVAWRPTRVFGG